LEGVHRFFHRDYFVLREEVQFTTPASTLGKQCSRRHIVVPMMLQPQWIMYRRLVRAILAIGP